MASIKPNESGSADYQLGPPMRGSITILNLPLAGIIAQSFRTNRSMMTGDPDWAGSTRYDIVAKGPDPTVTNPEVWEMMRSLLIDRFHLKYHIDQREMPIYALTVAPGGQKADARRKGRVRQGDSSERELRRHRADAVLRLDDQHADRRAPAGDRPAGWAANRGSHGTDRPLRPDRHLAARRHQSEGLDLGDIPKEFRPQEMALPEALEKQAGLKLVPERGPMPVLVVDSVSHPDPN